MMRASEAPIILAASTNSFSRSDSTCARTMRAGKNHPNTVKTTTSVTTPGARTPKVTLLRRSPAVAASAMMNSVAEMPSSRRSRER